MSVDLPVLVIPAYQPKENLIDLVRRLSSGGYPSIIVVNDGSSPTSQPIFDSLGLIPKVTLLKHATNLGKGYALKTAFNHVLNSFPSSVGVVTVDADGQHLPQDVKNVSEALLQSPSALLLGTRHFVGKIPFRSLFGNWMTRGVFFLFVGQAIGDTQTGLRGIPLKLLPSLMRIKVNGYDFELEMLITACARKIHLKQISIETIYENNNESSHFDPIFDSLRIYYVFFRFALSSFSSASIDFLVFTVAYRFLKVLLPSIVIGRLCSVVFNFWVGKKLVFKSKGDTASEGVKFVVLSAVQMSIAYPLIRALSGFYLNVYVAKAVVESLLFLFSFSIQRILVFSSSSLDEEVA